MQFEVFGDDNVPLAHNSGIVIMLFAGAEKLVELSTGSVYLPYTRFWYDNHFVFDITITAFDQVDRIDLIANADQIRLI
jgi:hypothetical protein